MTTTEFSIDLSTDNEGIGTLFITDARLLIRPAVPGQYPSSVRHNSAHAYRVLNLGNDMGQYTTRIIYHGSPEAAYQLLDRVFYAYVDACCLELWCDARVNYVVDGKIVKVKKHGFDDGEYTMYFNVYCNVAEADAESFLAALNSDFNEAERFVVVRPDSSDLGYAVNGFVVESSDNKP